MITGEQVIEFGRKYQIMLPQVRKDRLLSSLDLLYRIRDQQILFNIGCWFDRAVAEVDQLTFSQLKVNNVQVCLLGALSTSDQWFDSGGSNYLVGVERTLSLNGLAPLESASLWYFDNDCVRLLDRSADSFIVRNFTIDYVCRDQQIARWSKITDHPFIPFLSATCFPQDRDITINDQIDLVERIYSDQMIEVQYDSRSLDIIAQV